jgi:hypothetical protein
MVMSLSSVTKAFCGKFNSGSYSSGDGYSYNQWNFYDNKPLSTCIFKKCDGTGAIIGALIFVLRKFVLICSNSS